MPLSDRSQKTAKNKSPQATYRLPEKFEKGREAILEFLPVFEQKLALPDGSFHTGTMLSAAAWLTGTSLYRSFNIQTSEPPGTVIKADEINKEWESLMFLLEQYCFQRADIPVGRLMLAAMGAPDFLKSKVDMLQVQRELEEPFHTVMKKHGFDYLDSSRAGIILCTIYIQKYHQAKILDGTVGAGIVAQGVIEAAKTVPAPRKS